MTEMCSNELINFRVILTPFCEKSSQILFKVEMDRQRRGYTYSREFGMESTLLRYIFFCLFRYMN